MESQVYAKRQCWVMMEQHQVIRQREKFPHTQRARRAGKSIAIPFTSANMTSDCSCWRGRRRPRSAQLETGASGTCRVSHPKELTVMEINERWRAIFQIKCQGGAHSSRRGPTSSERLAQQARYQSHCYTNILYRMIGKKGQYFAVGTIYTFSSTVIAIRFIKSYNNNIFIW